ncbi:sodium:proton exchanger [Verrucomicrobia bacterium LW23]|nr:sodium:proton exchanger [Verrucomicrobia bacterium LW23]
MPHHLDLISTLTGGLLAALVLGFITQRLGLSPIVGYLLAGIAVGPHSPGFVADEGVAKQFAEIGVILLMFGVGLHFHLKDLLAVKNVAIPGAIVQIAVATALGAVSTHYFNWSWGAGILFGIAISVASTVVLTRVLADNRALHTPTGHIAVGWLIVEDLFTIMVLILLPTIALSTGTGAAPAAVPAVQGSGGGMGLGGVTEFMHAMQSAGQAITAAAVSLEPAGGGNAFITIGVAILRLGGLVVAFIVGQRLIPLILWYIARSGSRELFTLTVLVLALGIAVGSLHAFGASVELGAFLAGMIVGSSDYSARAAAEALPMKDAFAVLFFVAVGMRFDPSAIPTGWPLMLVTLAIVMIGKPIAALVVVLVLGKPLRTALAVAVALAQIGEFSFILADLGARLNILPAEAVNALVVASIISITLNPPLYQCIEPIAKWMERNKLAPTSKKEDLSGVPPKNHLADRAIVIGYGPVGKTLTRILKDNGIEVVIIEMNIDTVKRLRAEGENALYGDAMQRDILHHAGVEQSIALIISASGLPAQAIVQAARELNPEIQILTRSTYLREKASLEKAGANEVFAAEGEVALSMVAHIMGHLGATSEQIDRERARVREELF